MPEISYKKGASLYLGYWELIRDNPNQLVSLPMDRIYHRKFSKAIKKRKLEDVQFRKANPLARLAFYSSANTLKVVLLPKGDKISLLLS